MDTLPADFLSLALLTLVLGLKHGFDADHLATIDGFTRAGLAQGRRTARYAGTLFSLGHGAVVVAMAVGVNTLLSQWTVPAWFDPLGSAISIAFLLSLGVLNMSAVLSAPAHAMVQPVGLKSRFLGRLGQASHPAAVAAVGALFALSFDTLSQAAFFAVGAASFGGWAHALLLGLLFMLGMMLTDSINGLWIARLIARSDQIGLLASRVMSLVVSCMSLLVAALGLAKWLSPAVEHWSEGKELFFGGVMVGVILLAYGCAKILSKRAQTTHKAKAPLSSQA